MGYAGFDNPNVIRPHITAKNTLPRCPLDRLAVDFCASDVLLLG